MQKRTLTSLLLASALPLSAHALGLGNIEVYSALNQPLDAEIEITDVKPGETENLIVQLASERAFTRAGVQRPYLLNNLDFNSTRREDGTPVVKVTTKKPIREPFLNFLVDVEWPRGHLVREFTLLLDPPNFALRQPQQAAPAPEASRAPESGTAGSAPIEREPEPAPAEPAPQPAPEPAAASDSGTTAESEVDVMAAPVPAESGAQPEPAPEPEPEPEPEPQPEPQPEESVQPAELPPEAESEDSPFSDLLNDLEADQEAAFDEGGYAVTSQPESSESSGDSSPEPLPYGDSSATEADLAALDDETLPSVNVELDPNKSFNAESIVASDEAYIGPDVEQLFKANQERIYSEPEPMAAEPEPEPMPEPEPERPSEYAVQKGDIMLEIAEQFRPDGVDINQAMLAIMRANPEAFIQDNVNLVREGQVLRIPDANSMQSMPSGEALSEVLAQNTLWREYKSQIAGTQAASRETDTGTETAAEPADTAESTADSAQTGDGTQLSLVAPDEGESGTNYNAAGEQGDADSEGRLRRDLSLAKESLEASNLEKNEIESRISELEDIVTQSEGLIELQNEKMAQAQESAEQSNKADAEAEEAADDSKAASDEAAAAASEDDGEAAAEEQKAAPASARPAGIGGTIYDLLPEGMRPMMQPLLAGPLVWVILALPVVLLLVLLLVLRQRGGKQDDALENIVFDDDDSDSGEAPEKSDARDDTESTQVDHGGTSDFDADATMVVSPEEREAAAQAGSSASAESASDESEDDEAVQNTLAEADVYIAYGLFDQSEDLLKQCVDDNPDVPAYRGKLLESYFNAGKQDDFVAAAEALKEKIDPDTSRVWQKAVVMGKELAPDNPLFADAEVTGDLQASDFSHDRPDSPDVDLGGDGDIDLSSADIKEDAVDDDSADNVELEDDFSLGDVVAELDDDEDSPASPDEEESDDIDFDVDNFLSDTGADDDSGEEKEGEGDSDEPIADISLDLGDEEEGGDEAAASEAKPDAGDSGGDDDFGDLGDFDFDDESSGEETAEEKSDSPDFDLDSDEGDSASDDSAGDGFDLDMDALDDADDERPADKPEEPAADDSASDDDFAFDLDDLDDDEDSGESQETDLSADSDDDDGFDLDFDTGDDEEDDDAASETSMLDDDDLETMIDDIGEEGDIPEGEDMPDNLDEVGTKLDLAKAYIDMGDTEGAKSSLEEVIEEGSDEQKKAAEELLSQI